jgi:predicted peroxiredoxin
VALLLFSGTRGSDDPTRAALPLLAAQGALDGGHQTEVFLLGEAAYLMKDEIADSIQPVAFPNVGTMLRDLIGRGVRFYV